VTAPAETARCACPHADTLRQVADDLRIVHLVADNLRHDVAAEPGMEASEVLRRILGVLPAVPDAPEESPQ
jgi:hypothetical protein